MLLLCWCRVHRPQMTCISQVRPTNTYIVLKTHDWNSDHFSYLLFVWETWHIGHTVDVDVTEFFIQRHPVPGPWWQPRWPLSHWVDPHLQLTNFGSMGSPSVNCFFLSAERNKTENLQVVCIPTSFQVRNTKIAQGRGGRGQSWWVYSTGFQSLEIQMTKTWQPCW